MRGHERPYLFILGAPAVVLFAALFVIPAVRLLVVGASGDEGIAAYLAVFTHPRYFSSLVSTLALSIGVTFTALLVSTIAGLFLTRHRFPGRDLIVGLMTLPLAFPGVVIGFLVIMLAGRLGLIGTISMLLTGHKIVFAYSLGGLFLGYLYFSIPRVILTVMASAEKLDPHLEEAARSLGAGPWRVARDVIIPGLMPALISSGAIAFATAMGAFGTAFTLATNLNVLPMTIYTEFTLNANIAMASALSVVLGLITWGALAAARSAAGAGVAAAG